MSRKRLEIETRFQWSTYMKWHMGNRMVTWSMTSRDPLRVGGGWAVMRTPGGGFFRSLTAFLVKSEIALELPRKSRYPTVSFRHRIDSSFFSASFWRNLWNSDGFCIFIVRVALINIGNTPLHSSGALLLSVINLTYCSCTEVRKIRQIRLKIWPEPDLVGFPKMAGFAGC